VTIFVHVHVTPGSKHPGVGGRHGERLVVKVRERAVDGAATEAVRHALADACRVSPRAVSLIRGAASREKTFAVEGNDEAIAAKVAELSLTPNAGAN
jgi:uncharacterized protein YggU (UPF0235/DUF167 family)